MPVADHVPEPLKTALENMEEHVQSMKTSMAFAAPEMMDEHWINLQHGLASEMEKLFEQTKAAGSA